MRRVAHSELLANEGNHTPDSPTADVRSAALPPVSPRSARARDIADVFNGPQDTNWETDRDLVAQEFKPAEKDAQAGSGPAADSGVP